MLNPVVVAALKSLTDSINLSTGITHPNDQARAVSALEILHKAGYALDEEAIFAWACQARWDTHNAQSLAKLADKISKGKRVRKLSTSSWRADILEQWRTAASE